MSTMDAELIFSDEQALVATADSTNIVDLGAGVDFKDNAIVLNAGESGRQQWLNIVVITTFSSNPTSYTFELKSSATVGGSYVMRMATPAIVVATLVAGYVVYRGAIPAQPLERFLKIVYTETGGSAEDEGVVSAWIGPSGQQSIRLI